MDKFGDSLRHVYEKFDCHFSNKTIIQIGIQIVGILEKIHKNGYIFNDLKPDNILVGNITLNEAKKEIQKNTRFGAYCFERRDSGRKNRGYGEYGNETRIAFGKFREKDF